MIRYATFLAALLCVCFARARAESSADDADLVRGLAGWRADYLASTAIGVTRRGTPIRAWIPREVESYRSRKTRVLLVGGARGEVVSTRAILRALIDCDRGQDLASLRRSMTLAAVPCLNPDAVLSRDEGKRGGTRSPSRSYPPRGTAYSDADCPESLYLWRWIGMYAPDVVLEIRCDSEPSVAVPSGTSATLSKLLRERLPSVGLLDAERALAVALAKYAPCETGTIPAIEVRVGKAGDSSLRKVLGAIGSGDKLSMSPARLELVRRTDRSPLEIASSLSGHYGHALREVVYIPAVALIARLGLGELTAEATHRADVGRLIEPYLYAAEPSQPSSGSGLSGHLIFSEWARLARGESRAAAIARVKAVADLAFDSNGRPNPSMPFHNEMSDALFMGGPILAAAGQLTGDSKYFDACVRHLRFMRKLVLRDDGLYRHSPLDEAAWGRGNGFPALGLALCLTDLPRSHPARAELVEWFRRHLRVLMEHQSLSGAWHQVIDHPESYRELTSTSMITFAMVRGMRRGWLPEPEFRSSAKRGWRAVQARVGRDGRLVDVCTGTGKQRSLRAYLDRKAILGRDDRGGAMALLCAVEIARFERERSPSK